MLDYFGLEEDLDAEARLIRDTAREFVADQLQPDIADHFAAGTFPRDVIPEMGDLGFFGADLQGFDLPNIGPIAHGLLMQELEACDSGIRSMVSVQGSLVMYPIYTYGSEAQQSAWIPELATGEAIGCFALTEPQHGSDPAAMDATATPDGDGYRLNGTKTWITNAPIADVLLVWARDQGSAEAPIRGFLVEPETPGVTVQPIGEKLSMRVSATGQISLDDAWVPADAVLPDVSGMSGPLSCLTKARYGIVWGAVGAARDCFETAREYAQERTQFGGPIARFQLQQGKIADMATQLSTAQMLAHRLGRLTEQDRRRYQQVSMGKRHNVRVARDVARTAREMLGGNGITLDYSPMRHLANMETVYTYEGTDDIHTLILGEDLTGISAFS